MQNSFTVSEVTLVRFHKNHPYYIPGLRTNRTCNEIFYATLRIYVSVVCSAKKMPAFITHTVVNSITIIAHV